MRVLKDTVVVVVDSDCDAARSKVKSLYYALCSIELPTMWLSPGHLDYIEWYEGRRCTWRTDARYAAGAL